MLTMHGATYLQIRTEGVIEQRARTAARIAGIALVALFALAGIWAAFGLSGYRITAMPPAGSAFAPLAKTVAVAPGGWLANYAAYSWMWLAPIAAFAGAGGAIVFSGWGRAQLAFLCSGAALAGVILTAGFAMFPFVMPSSTDPNSSLTVWDAVSSHRTLGIMFWVVVLMLPVVIAYTAWVFHVLRGKITVEHTRETTHTVTRAAYVVFHLDSRHRPRVRVRHHQRDVAGSFVFLGRTERGKCAQALRAGGSAD